jgi:hypothetical protein
VAGFELARPVIEEESADLGGIVALAEGPEQFHIRGLREKVVKVDHAGP